MVKATAPLHRSQELLGVAQAGSTKGNHGLAVERIGSRR
jgi:hypothetical protein